MRSCLTWARYMLWLPLASAIAIPARNSAQQPSPYTAVFATQRETAPTAAAEATLGRFISLHLERVTLRAALDTIAARGKVHITYGIRQVPIDRIVNVVADKITVGDALHLLLQDAGVAVMVFAPGRIILSPSNAASHADAIFLQQGTAVLHGVITDSVTGNPIPGAIVRIDGTSTEMKSGSDGQYHLTGLAAGDYRLTVRRVGYLAKTRAISLSEGETKALNFPLNAPATQLNEVVTTALGEQRRYQVGNVIATINVDSIAPTAPVTSVTDLIEGRAAGVEIEETSGLVGGGEAIRIRGQSSLLIQGDPILIIDGVREDNSPGTALNPMALSGSSSPGPARINDLDFSQIQSIDILKGPAATTEYGTDAANGVIVITTKRGTAGAPLWHVDAQKAASVVPTNFPNYYYAWGHSTSNGALTDCPVVPVSGGAYAQYGPPNSTGEDLGTCVTDSVVAFNPLNHKATTEYGTGPSGKYDLDVSGGSDAFRYFVAGGLMNATGGSHIPDVFRPEAKALNIPDADLNPNGEQQRSGKANMNIQLSQTAEVQLNVGYTSTYQFTPDQPILGYGPTIGPALDDSAHDYGYGAQYNFYNSPISMMGGTNSQQTDAVTTGLTSTWRPSGWFLAHITLGLQHETGQDLETLYPQALQVGFPGSSPYGELGYVTSVTDLYTVDFRTSATLPVTHIMKSITSLGVQMVDSRQGSTTAQAEGLNDNNYSQFTAGQYNQGMESLARSATLGGYAEEQLAFVDRLFVTGALRVDAGSGFGRTYTSAAYPKLSVSWLAYDNGQTSLRLRGALGGAGKQPPAGAALQTFSSTYALVNGAGGPALFINAPGTPGLQPERTIEDEGGFDLSFWQNRVSLEFTAYSKTTQNALYARSLGFDLGGQTQYENLGEVTNSGLEGTVTATLIQSRIVMWNVTLNASENGNKLVHLIAGLQTTPQGQSAGAYQYFSIGYPLYSYFDENVHYTDLNHDGILEPNEVTRDTINSYQGASLPKQEASLATHLAFWRGTVALGALFDYQAGFKIVNWAAQNAASNSLMAAQNEILGELSNQALAWYGSTSYDNGDFVRFRELNLTYVLPRRWAHAARVSTLSLTGAVRNVYLWTGYYGDPEATSTVFSGTYQPASATTFINNDLRADFANVPLQRSWMVRLNLGF